MTALHTEEYRRFLRALGEARRAAGISQVELGQRLGMPQTFVSKVELGRRRLDVIEFLRFVKAIGVDPMVVLASVQADPGRFSSSED